MNPGETSVTLHHAMDEEELAQGRRAAKAGIAVLALAFFGAGAWAAIAPITGAVVAPGLLTVDTNRKTVQHLEGGIVKEIRVRNGDRVRQGDVLLVLDDVRVDAGFALVSAQLDAELARSARLAAERDLAPAIEFPHELAGRSADARVAEVLRRERLAFAVRRQSQESQQRLIASQIGELREEVRVRLARRSAERRAIGLQQEEIDANAQLSQQGFVSRTRLLALERARTDYEARLAENDAEISKARQRIADLELRAVSLRSTYLERVADESKESSARLSELRERVRPSEDAARRQRIVAPVDGEVTGLGIATVGATIGPREPILDIVPDNPHLVAEAHVRPEDIAHVRTGSSAEVRLTALNQRLTPMVAGRVEYVSADRVAATESVAAHYVARIRIEPGALRGIGPSNLRAGMPAEVYVKTAERTPAEYLAEPVMGFIQRAAREP